MKEMSDMNDKRDNRKDTGRRGEELAAQYLLQKGYVIVDRNYRTRYGEIDIVAKDGETLVFVEVRSRTTLRLGSGAESVNWRKQNKIRQMANWYLFEKGLHEVPVRFDVISIYLSNINHIVAAF